MRVGMSCPVQGAEVAQAEFIEEQGGEDEVLGGAFQLEGEVPGLRAPQLFNEGGRLVPQPGEGFRGLQGVEVFCQRAHVFINGPFIVVQNGDVALGGLADVVQRLQGGAAGECRIPGHGHYMVVLPFQIPGRAHAQGGGKRRARVACTVGVMGGFRHFGKAGEPFMLADGVNQRGAPREHFMDVGLVGNVKDDFVPWCFKDAVKGNAQFHHAQVGAQMAAGEGKGVDEGVPDFFREPG